MKRRQTSGIRAVNLAVAAALSLASFAASSTAQQSVLPALPATPSAGLAVKIVSMQPVILRDAYPTDFRSERPQVSAGWLVVIRADSSVLAPRALAEPLLLASGPTWIESVEWFNHGMVSGHRVCFVPSPVNEQGLLSHDLTGLRIWFGTPHLPESVDAAMLAQERALADAARMQPTAVGQVAVTANLANREALIAAARLLIARFAPDEVQTDGVAVPVAPLVPAAR